MLIIHVMGAVHLHVQMCPFSVSRKRLDTANGEVQVHVHLYLCTYRCTFPYLGNGYGQFALKFGVWLEDLCALHRMVDIRTSARVTVHTFQHICSLPLVHRPKGGLLVLTFLRYSQRDKLALPRQLLTHNALAARLDDMNIIQLNTITAKLDDYFTRLKLYHEQQWTDADVYGDARPMMSQAGQSNGATRVVKGISCPYSPPPTAGSVWRVMF